MWRFERKCIWAAFCQNILHSLTREKVFPEPFSYFCIICKWDKTGNSVTSYSKQHFLKAFFFIKKMCILQATIKFQLSYEKMKSNHVENEISSTNSRLSWGWGFVKVFCVLKMLCKGNLFQIPDDVSVDTECSMRAVYNL